MSKVLITGSAGFIGHFLAQEFSYDHEVLCLVRPGSKNLDRLKSLRSQVTIVEHDIRHSYDLLYNDFKDIEIILHAGGNPSAESSINDPVSAVKDNIFGTLHLLELARKLPLRRFVYYSAAEIFGPIPIGTDSHETDPYNSVSPYSASKAGGQELCVAYSKTYNIPVSIVHITNTFGERSQSNRLPVIAIKKLLNNEPIDIHVDPTGFIGGRRWFHAGSVAAHTRFILDNQIGFCEKWNSSGPAWLTNEEFVKKIAQILDRSAQINYAQTNRPGHETYLSITPEKLYRLGYKDKHTVDESLAKTVQWYQENQEWLTRD